MSVQPCVQQQILPDAMVIANATVVTPAQIEEDADVLVSNGIIERIGSGRPPAGARVLDAKGMILLPGFVDIHSDAVETAIQPRPGGRFPTAMALRELDRNLVACGITTMFHSLSFCDGLQTGMRNSNNCARLIREINQQAPKLKAHTRVHLRFEITETESVPLIEALINDQQVHFFSFMDHTPGQGQFVDENQFRSYYGKVRGKNNDELDELIADRISARTHVDDTLLLHISDCCRRNQIHIASHDDDTADKVRWNRFLGVDLAEFPVTMEAARKAREYGMHVSLGAPNILRGGSATGNLSAREAIAAGYGTIICSDYAPVAMLHAGMTLVQQGRVDLVQMSRMLSGHPAKAAGIDHICGAIEEGKAADLLLVDLSDDLPSIQRTFVAGQSVYASC